MVSFEGGGFPFPHSHHWPEKHLARENEKCLTGQNCGISCFKHTNTFWASVPEGGARRDMTNGLLSSLIYGLH